MGSEPLLPNSEVWPSVVLTNVGFPSSKLWHLLCTEPIFTLPINPNYGPSLRTEGVASFCNTMKPSLQAPLVAPGINGHGKAPHRPLYRRRNSELPSLHLRVGITVQGQE